MNILLSILHINTLAIVLLLGGQTFRYFAKNIKYLSEYYHSLPLQRNVQSSFLLISIFFRFFFLKIFGFFAKILFASFCRSRFIPLDCSRFLLRVTFVWLIFIFCIHPWPWVISGYRKLVWSVLQMRNLETGHKPLNFAFAAVTRYISKRVIKVFGTCNPLDGCDLNKRS